MLEHFNLKVHLLLADFKSILREKKTFKGRQFLGKQEFQEVHLGTDVVWSPKSKNAFGLEISLITKIDYSQNQKINYMAIYPSKIKIS